MPQFAVLIYAPDSLHAYDQAEDELRENDEHAARLAESGAMQVAYAFTPRNEARSVRSTGVSSGPFVDAEHVVAGFYVLEATDIDAAVEIARANPAVQSSAGGVEIRPIHSGGVVA